MIEIFTELLMACLLVMCTVAAIVVTILAIGVVIDFVQTIVDDWKGR